MKQKRCMERYQRNHTLKTTTTKPEQQQKLIGYLFVFLEPVLAQQLRLQAK